MREFISTQQFSPPAVVDRLSIPQGHIYVVRDDVLDGGTKQRAAVPYIEQLAYEGVREFIYASPFAGFAQVAMAVACREVGVRATVFAERDPAIPTELKPHLFTQLAKKFGARIVLCESLAEAEHRAERRSQIHVGSQKVPLGFNTPVFKEFLRKEVRLQWSTLIKELPRLPRQIWLPVGSGTLAQIFSEVVPQEVLLRCVDVRVLPPTDQRLKLVDSLARTICVRTPEVFADPCSMQPPIPSNQHYDAKLWRFIERDALDGDLWWNVAR